MVRVALGLLVGILAGSLGCKGVWGPKRSFVILYGTALWWV